PRVAALPCRMVRSVRREGSAALARCCSVQEISSKHAPIRCFAQAVKRYRWVDESWPASSSVIEAASPKASAKLASANACHRDGDQNSNSRPTEIGECRAMQVEVVRLRAISAAFRRRKEPSLIARA